MRKGLITVLVALSLLAAAVPSHAKTACVVVSKRIQPYLQAFEGLREVLGNDIKRFDLDGNRAKGAEVVRNLRDDGCAVVVPVGSLALDIVRLQVTNLPVVYSMVAAPSKSVRDAAHITGINIEPSVADLFSTLRRLIPNAKTVGAIYNPGNTSAYVVEARKAAGRMGLVLEVKKATSMKEMAAGLKDLLPRVDAFLMVPDSTTAHQKAFEFILLESLRRGIPIIGVSAKHVKAGALFSFSADYRDAGRKAGHVARSVMAGTPPNRVAISQAAGVLVLNLKAARRLGLHIEQSIIDEAGAVYR
jgi:putative ABC transport system substrate-binding protein